MFWPGAGLSLALHGDGDREVDVGEQADMPAPGCWTLHLSWGGHTDQLSLRYVR